MPDAQHADAYEQSPAGLQQIWTKEIELAEKELRPWHATLDRVLQAYLDKRDPFDAGKSKVNLFWSTTQVQLASMYARPPKVDVSRTYDDHNDDVARVAGFMLERILNNDFQDTPSTLRKVFQQAIKDRLILGAGQVWCRYEVDTQQQTIDPQYDEFGNPLGEPVTAEVIVDERAPIDYVQPKDFLWSPARTWEEVRWVARVVHMRKEQVVKRFGEEVAAKLQYSNDPKYKSPLDVQSKAWSTACIYEIWCKDTKRVYWYSKGCNEILEVRDDPLGLRGFFPCPEPLFANLVNARLLPKSDYEMAADQYEEINELKTRIRWLVKACRVAGVYDASTSGQIGRLFQEGAELQLIPVDNWAMFAEKGGVQGTISFVPIQQIADTIVQLRQELASAQQHLYEVLGISDIMRGATDPDETLGAQQLKAQFGSSRMQFTLNEIAQWIANACTIRAEIICRHWQPDTIIKRSNVLATPDAQLAPQAVQLLKTDEWRWRITVEPDTIASIDYAQERDARTQLLQHLSVLVQNVQPLVQNAPQAVPLVMQLVKWAMASFKVGKEIEGALDQAIEAANAAAQQPPPPPMEIELEKMRHANQLALQQMKSDTERDIQASKAALEVLKLGMENRLQAITQMVQVLADNLAQQRDDVRAQLAMQRDLSQIPPQLQTSLDALQLSIDELANRKPPKRRRRPIRDENGDIVEVIEEDIPEEEEQAQQPAVPPTPPTVLPPGVM